MLSYQVQKLMLCFDKYNDALKRNDNPSALSRSFKGKNRIVENF